MWNLGGIKTHLTDLGYGGSDHMSFEGADVPGFMFNQEIAGYGFTHHSQSDTLDKAREPDLIQSAQVMSVCAMRVANLPELLPRTECLKDVVARMLPYWYDAIVPDLAAGHTVLVAAHGNSLRAMVKHLDGISDSAIAELNIPTGIPLVYELDASMRPTTAGGRYLDPEAAAAAAEAVKNQGR